jgi:hypothetical protein
MCECDAGPRFHRIPTGVGIPATYGTTRGVKRRLNLSKSSVADKCCKFVATFLTPQETGHSNRDAGMTGTEPCMSGWRLHASVTVERDGRIMIYDV